MTLLLAAPPVHSGEQCQCPRCGFDDARVHAEMNGRYRRATMSSPEEYPELDLWDFNCPSCGAVTGTLTKEEWATVEEDMTEQIQARDEPEFEYDYDPDRDYFDALDQIEPSDL